MPGQPQGCWCLQRGSRSSQVSLGFVYKALMFASLPASHHYGWVKQLSSSPGVGCIPPESPHLSDSSHRSPCSPSHTSAWGAGRGVLLACPATDMDATFPTLGACNTPRQGEMCVEVPAAGAHCTLHPITA